MSFNTKAILSETWDFLHLLCDGNESMLGECGWWTGVRVSRWQEVALASQALLPFLGEQQSIRSRASSNDFLCEALGMVSGDPRELQGSEHHFCARGDCRAHPLGSYVNPHARQECDPRQPAQLL